MKVKELLSDESKWTKGFHARKADGSATSVESKEAVSFCLVGAVLRCYPIGYPIALKVIRKGIRRMKLRCSVYDWNDRKKRTFADVKNLVEELDI